MRLEGCMDKVGEAQRWLLHLSLLLQLNSAVMPQVKLMAEVNAMLSSFAEQKAAAVASAVACMHNELAQGRSSTETSFNALSQAASSANDAIKASIASQTLNFYRAALADTPVCHSIQTLTGRLARVPPLLCAMPPQLSPQR